MDRVQAECRKCGEVFTTAAKTRTTCPGCKAAVTVRRDPGQTRLDVEDGEIPLGSGWATAITALGALALVVFGLLKGRGADSNADA